MNQIYMCQNKQLVVTLEIFSLVKPKECQMKHKSHLCVTSWSLFMGVKWAHCCPFWLMREKHPLHLQFSTTVPVPVGVFWPQGGTNENIMA